MRNNIIPVVLVIILVSIVLLSFWAIVEEGDTCKKLGGVVVTGYLSQNCWKDGGYINVD